MSVQMIGHPKERLLLVMIAFWLLFLNESCLLQTVLFILFFLFQIVDAIGRIEQTRGETNTAAALHDIRRHFFSVKHSPRDGIVRIAIIVTDGRSDDPLATSREATLLRDSGVHVFAVGVGQDIDMGELHAIASRPAEDYVNTVDNYDALNSIKELLAIKACQGELYIFTFSIGSTFWELITHQ